MVAAKQQTCKCVASVADFLNDISIFGDNLREAKVENSDTYIPAFRSSVNSIYSNIGKIDDNCGIDTSQTRWSSSDIYNKVDKVGATKDPAKFNESKSAILVDLSRIKYGIVQKIKDCSK